MWEPLAQAQVHHLPLLYFTMVEVHTCEKLATSVQKQKNCRKAV